MASPGSSSGPLESRNSRHGRPEKKPFLQGVAHDKPLGGVLRKTNTHNMFLLLTTFLDEAGMWWTEGELWSKPGQPFRMSVSRGDG